MNLNKLKSQKGLTGIDVVIAITIISTITIAVLAIYVNLVVGSKKNSRTSSATRIATSILQNIDSMYYADVERELIDIGKDAGILNGSENNASFEVTLTNTNIFQTKIPKGYSVKLEATEYTSNSDKQDTMTSDDGTIVYGASVENCPLVWNIKVTVLYDVSGKEEHITLKTIKKREILQVSNEPDLNKLIGIYDYGGSNFKIKSLKQVQPIKWSMVDGAYVKTNSSDPDWYNYENKEWAKVIVFEHDVDNTAFSPSTGAIDNDTISSGGKKVFIWVPRYGISTNDSSIAFAYGSSNSRIQKITGWLNINRYLYFWGVKSNARPRNWNAYDEERLAVDSSIFPEGASGVWVDVTNGSVNGCNYSEITDLPKIFTNLQNTKYGPASTHYKLFYY